MSISPSLAAADLHRKRFATKCAVFQAPGRVNLIGEHTDTSEGFVMPAALDLCTVSTIGPRNDAVANIYSANFDEQISFDLGHVQRSSRNQWNRYPAAVLQALQQRGIQFGGFDMTLSGNVPLGSGLSSSASVEVAIAIAVLAHAGVGLSKTEIAKICQIAENKFIGTQTGIMDPLASCCGVEGHALLLDCRSLNYEPLPLPAEVAIVICNSMVQHSLYGDGDYNQRRFEVQQGLRILQSRHLEIRALRDATKEDLRAAAKEMPEHIFRRCLHVVTENRRVLEAADALRRHDFLRFGTLMREAHTSMKENYAASCPEADTLVDLAMQQPGCYGARITGAGFGGCTVSLVAAKRAGDFARNVRAGYKQATGIDTDIYLTRASNGAGPLATFEAN